MQLPLLEFLAGLVLGAFVTFLFLRRDPEETKRLREELEEVKADYNDYRVRVNDHFSRSSVLFKGVTEGYRHLYEHLSDGATSLCQPETTLPKLELPEADLALSRVSRQAAPENGPAMDNASGSDDTTAEWEANGAVSYLSAGGKKRPMD